MHGTTLLAESFENSNPNVNDESKATFVRPNSDRDDRKAISEANTREILLDESTTRTATGEIRGGYSGT